MQPPFLPSSSLISSRRSVRAVSIATATTITTTTTEEEDEKEYG
jgi:hypothetical protein